MNRSLKVFTKLYKPFKISKINSVYIFYTMDGNYVLKLNPRINYKELYNYLNSRSFNYLPKYSVDSRDDMAVFDYQEDVYSNNDQKIMDMIEIISLLHIKTLYFKDITLDKYKKLYEDLKNNINYNFKYYEDKFNYYIEKEYNSPSEYLLLRNYSIIYGAFYYCLEMLDKWYLLVKDKTKQRVCLIHYNLKLEHFIKNTESYLISWDNYSYDTPILDLYILYKNEWENVSFFDVFNKYNNSIELLEEEKILFNILISLPYINEKDSNEYEKCVFYRKLINYLDSSSKIIFDI